MSSAQTIGIAPKGQDTLTSRKTRTRTQQPGAAQRLPPRKSLVYGAAVNRIAGPESLVEQPIPDLHLPSSAGGTFALRGRVGVGPLALFFYIHNGTAG